MRSRRSAASTEAHAARNSARSIRAKCRSIECSMLHAESRNMVVVANPTKTVTRTASDVGRRARFSMPIGDVQGVAHAAHGLDQLGLETVIDFGP